MLGVRRPTGIAQACLGLLAVVSAAVALAPGVSASPVGAAALTAPLVQQVGADDTLPAFKPNASDYIQHSTEVETDSFSYGSTVVSAYQVGRNYPTYGAQAIGFSTSTDDGRTWTHGLLPGLTTSSPQPNAQYPLVVNQSVGYSAKYGRWVVPSVTYLASSATAFKEAALLVNTSSDGLTWSDATTAVPTNADKAWVSCDNNRNSPGWGDCYILYSQIDSGEILAATTSTDGGLTWSSPVNLPGAAASTIGGYNTNVVVQPSGRVVVVATDLKNGSNGSQLTSSVSDDQGATWSPVTPFATIKYHKPLGGIRALDKPSVDVDAAGTVYAAWSDCRFRVKCASNDIVFATSTDGRSWSAPSRVAIDATSSTADRFIPGFAVAPGTSGSTAQLSVAYYTYPTATCSSSTCRLNVEYSTSLDGGATWSTPYTINPLPMPLSWLAYNTAGRMVGDYESVSFCDGNAITVASVATAAPTPKTKTTPLTYHQSEFALTMPPPTVAADSSISVRRTPATVAYRSQGLLSGVVHVDGGSSSGLRVDLQDRPAGASGWSTVGETISRDGGDVSVPVRPKRTTSYRWHLLATSTTRPAYSPAVTMTLRPTLRVQVSSTSVHKGTSVLVTGSTEPGVSKAPVVLQRRSGGSFRSVRHGTLDAHGRYRFTMAVPDGMSKIRVQLKSTRAFGSTTSRTLNLHGH